MAVASLRSPHVLNSPLEFLPVTRFPTMDERLDNLHEFVMENRKEREVIQAQPYRTTPLIHPNPKTRPDLVNNKLTGKVLKPTIYRPLDPKSVVANLNEDQALVNRQFNSPRPLYSDQNIQEAIYVQTGVNFQQQQPQQQQVQHQQTPLQYLPQKPQLNYQQQQQQQRRQQQQPQQQAYQAPQSHLSAPIHRTPDSVPDFDPQKSPTFRAIIEEEGLGTLQPATAPQRAPPQKQAHTTAPTYNLNSVGMPNDRIAQSGTFKRLMWSVMGDY